MTQPTIGYHASHEQFAPEQLLGLVQCAAKAGFDAAMCSDHFHPWTAAQGHSGHAWAWLGSAMQACRLPFGVVTCPAGRYHPAVVAQAAATLARMHEDRLWIAVGSGEALNESITGEEWPSKPCRNRRLQQAAAVMRALWAGKEVDHDGAVQVRHARLYSRPERPPLMLAAALSEDTAEWAGGWADGLITVSRPATELRGIVDAFRRGGGAGKPLYLQVKLSWAPTEQEAIDGAFDQWRANVLPPATTETLATPARFEAAAANVSRDDIRRSVRVSADPARHAAWMRDDLALGFDQLYLHNVNRRQADFIECFGRDVLPQLRRAAADAPSDAASGSHTDRS